MTKRIHKPHCPECGALLEVTECMSIDEENEYIVRNVLGECPECESQYEWEEIYTYARYENLEALDEE